MLFSGGVDSTVIAAIAGLILDPEEPIDLINVSFSLTVSAGDTKMANNLREMTTTPVQIGNLLLPLGKIFVAYKKTGNGI